MNITGSVKKQKEPKRDIDNYRVKDNKLQTTDKSYWLKKGEKVMFNKTTKEVRIR